VSASAVARGARRTARHRSHRLRAALDRPRLWRVTAALAALLLAAITCFAAQGSVTVIARARAGGDLGWARWCTRGQVRLDRRRIAYCARVDGLVLATSRGPDPGEIHLAVVGGFHLTIVRLPNRSRDPGIGARVTAVGPLLRARDGQREVQAFHWEST
jgi:hypothetical protein